MRSKTRINVGFLIVVLCSTYALGQHRFNATDESKDVREFLQQYVGRDSYPSYDKPTRYLASFVDLNGSGSDEVIVYLMNGGWCGSGGCTTLILAQDKTSYRVVTRVTITWPPIRVLETKSHGWRDIAVWVEGGGIQPGYEALLQFDGEHYPANPSVGPAKRLDTQLAGTVVVPKNVVGELLY
jgi:hypothetical protein